MIFTDENHQTTESRRIQVRWRWCRIPISHQRRPTRTTPKTCSGNNRSCQGSLLFQEPSRQFRVSLMSDRSPERWLVSGAYPGTQTSDKPSPSSRSRAKGRQKPGWWCRTRCFGGSPSEEKRGQNWTSRLQDHKDS